MPYRALAVDFDGTLAPGGRVEPAALDALGRLKRSGRRLVLLTGRRLDDLRRAFPEAEGLCDAIVCENGGVVHEPESGATRTLAGPPPPALVEALRRKGATPVEVGQAAVYTRTPHEKTAIDAIRELALTLDVSFNRGAVIILPPGTDKAAALGRVLERFAVAPEAVVGMGDGENDHAFLRLCGRSVAVADAVASVREDADAVTAGAAGAGVVEEIGRLLAEDPARTAPAQPATAAAPPTGRP
ncbi:HAD family hydrolase [Azospirillum sp. A39]|uniref:HAD family hydrolase n=1 Tax=Azospirillum sp. A39 TaxID=3462279 RepID=UPI0040455433